MRLSIVVPVYNVAEYLPKCVKSLMAQDLADCEILLVDDGSTDGESGRLCDEYAAAHPGVIRVIHKPNGGLGDARNVGLEAAAGDYVVFVDSDDYIAPETLRTLKPCMEQGLDVTVFGYWVDRDGTYTAPPGEELPFGRVTDLAHDPSLLLASPSAWNKLWKRSLFMEEGIRFPARVWYEDLATTGKLLAAAKQISAIPDRLYYYVVREGSITRNGNTERNLEVISAVQGVVDWYSDSGLLDRYHSELEALAVKHVLLAGSVRVIRADAESSVPEGLLEYVQEAFPNWQNNPYVRRFPLKHRMILRWVVGRKYRRIRLLFAIKDRGFQKN